jgi:hypothetical protein
LASRESRIFFAKGLDRFLLICPWRQNYPIIPEHREAMSFDVPAAIAPELEWPGAQPSLLGLRKATYFARP